MHQCDVLCFISACFAVAACKFGAVGAVESDIECLKSIKSSLQDPQGILSSWSFDDENEGSICSFTGIECWNDNESRVLSINLSGMSLKGPFPRGVSNCSSLSGLDLSDNELHGTIPSDISQIIPYVTTLDLSYNRFSSEIPGDMAKISYVNVLRLNNNRLTGRIPPEFGLLHCIREFSVANNELTGLVPDFVSARVKGDSYANNSGLCGGPLEPCEDSEDTAAEFRGFFIGGFLTGWSILTASVFYLRQFGVPGKNRSKELVNKCFKFI